MSLRIALPLTALAATLTLGACSESDGDGLALPTQYEFESRFVAGESSVNYQGQICRHVLISALTHLGVLAGEAPLRDARRVEIASPHQSLYAPGAGIFDRAVSAGQDVRAGDIAGQFHFVMEPERPSLPVRVAQDGFILAHTCRGHVTRGELLALVAQDVA